MIDNQKINKIIESIRNFTFEYDFEEAKRNLELLEVSDKEIEELGLDKVKENFTKGIFKLKFANEVIVDANSIHEYCRREGIKASSIFQNPKQKYVKFEFKNDLTFSQIKRYIRRQIATSNESNFETLQKNAIIESLKNKQVDGYVNGVGVKTSSYIKKGKFYTQASCSEEVAYKQLLSEIESLRKEQNLYVTKKVNKNRLKMIYYVIFIGITLTLWSFNNYCETLASWLANSISITLFIISFLVMRFINHSAIKLAFNKKKAKKEFKADFLQQLIDN